MRELIAERISSRTTARPSGDFLLDPNLRREIAGKPMRPAAVLMPIVERPSAMTVLLTKRTDHLNAHAGQISFPGGCIEDHDEDAIATALRETEEEVGLDPSHVEVVGTLDEYHTGTGFAITPVVGFVRPGFTVRPDPFEVAEVFEVPFDFLMDPANHKRHRLTWKGREREYYAVPWEGYYIWGATAGMLVNLSKLIRE
ncbi:MAG: CoA pyrophosphatase [Alphaproteobacteria bacterium]|nr:MAG: CoA pyrophosphatase [Alphaproteobacteria bacterium]